MRMGGPGYTTITTIATNSPRLIGLMGAYTGKLYPLVRVTVSVGRDKSNTIVLADDRMISRRHAEIHLQNGDAVIKDIGSTNGTFVNGSRIVSALILRAGDEIRFGDTRFRFEA